MNYSRIVAGTAPSGNITLWMGAGPLNTEISRFKAVCKGIWQENNPEYDKFYEEVKKSKETINSESSVFLYLHGIPYQVWEKKQPEYDWDSGFTLQDSAQADYKRGITYYTR